MTSGPGRLIGCLLALGVALWGSGCGGSGGSGSIALACDAALDGFVRSDGVAVSAGNGPAVGDLDNFIPGVGVRQFVSFSLGSLPASGTLVSATLQMRQLTVLGAPFGTHGVVVLDHLDYGPTLDALDFGRAPLAGPLGPFAPDATLGVRTLDVTAQVAADLAAGRVRSQFRLRFSMLDSDNDGSPDAVAFTDAERSHGSEAPGDEPVLVVTWQE